jgi:hypothetical protein
MPLIRSPYIYDSKDVRIRGYYLRPKGVHRKLFWATCFKIFVPSIQQIIGTAVPAHDKKYVWEWAGGLYPFSLNLALDGSQCSSSRASRFNLADRTNITH